MSPWMTVGRGAGESCTPSRKRLRGGGTIGAGGERRSVLGFCFPGGSGGSGLDGGGAASR
jgi:hypothetical protein